MVRGRADDRRALLARRGPGTGTPAVIRFGSQFKAFGVGTDRGDSGDWTDSDRTKLFTMPAFNGLWFGWWMYNLAEPHQVWIDEIAVDYKPIGCAK